MIVVTDYVLIMNPSQFHCVQDENNHHDRITFNLNRIRHECETDKWNSNCCIMKEKSLYTEGNYILKFNHDVIWMKIYKNVHVGILVNEDIIRMYTKIFLWLKILFEWRSLQFEMALVEGLWILSRSFLCVIFYLMWNGEFRGDCHRRSSNKLLLEFCSASLENSAVAFETVLQPDEDCLKS